MKKHILIIIGIFIVSLGSTQELPPNILGIRGGINFSSVTANKIKPDSYTTSIRNGLNIGISYQRLLSKSNKWYIETGLYLTNKGFKQNVHIDEISIDGHGMPIEIKKYDAYQTGLLYLQVPVLINYHISLNNNITLEPFAGMYASYGISGRTKLIDIHIFHAEGSAISYKSEIMNSFNKKTFKHIDIGFKLGLGITFYHVHIGIGYEAGITKIGGEYYPNIYMANLKYNNGQYKVRNKNWIIQVGYSMPLYPKQQLKNRFNRIYPLEE
ncbi:MAG: PorT family protein [Prevotellaceae bacterium]|jgi:hypothetical protein|nr:PorT family protein [Prevotellaceae bacterium]